jgi:enamine deaminase RidA (YjgF/YER057c/UK114 family)
MRPVYGIPSPPLLKLAMEAVLVSAVLAAPPPQRQDEREEVTQTLRLPPELPAALAGETSRLGFFVTPLSAKGLLSQQVKDALKQLRNATDNAQVLHIRAYVAGSGDLRRVRELVSETFSAANRPLPALTVVRAGGFPLAGAQVQMEAVAVGRKEVNPNGLAFLSPPAATAADPRASLGPLVDSALKSLERAFEAAGAQAADALRVTCYFSSLDQVAEVRAKVRSAYPNAAQDYVQTARSPSEALAAFEAVARVRKPAARLTAVNGRSPTGDAGSSLGVVIASRFAVFTGVQVSFGFDESDGRTAISRLRATLERAGASWKDVAIARFYPVSTGLAARVLKLRAELFAQPALAGTPLVWEGLASLDAGFGVDLVAAKD